MSQDNGSGAAGLVLAFVAGAVTGAAVALLFAPASGEETREFLMTQAKDSRERAAELAKQGREVVAHKRDQVVEAFERGRQAFQAARDQETDA